MTVAAAADGAAPVIRARERNVFEVAVTTTGDSMRGKTVYASSSRFSTCLRSFFTALGLGGSSSTQSRVRRPAPSGRDRACEGSSSWP